MQEKYINFMIILYSAKLRVKKALQQINRNDPQYAQATQMINRINSMVGQICWKQREIIDVLPEQGREVGDFIGDKTFKINPDLKTLTPKLKNPNTTLTPSEYLR